MKNLKKVNKGALWALFVFLSACNANSPETKFLLAEKLLEDKKYEAAISEFQNIVDKAPNSRLGLEAQLKLAQIQHLYLGRSQDAIDSYQEFLKRSKDESLRREVEKTMADLQFHSFENYSQAIASYSKLLNENPDSEKAEELLFRLGRAFFLKAKFEDAIKMFELQKEKYPDGALVWRTEFEIGNALGAKGKCQDAIKQYEKVIEQGPRDQGILAIFAKASCYEEQDELDKAYELFSSIKEIYPSPSVVELKMQKIKRRKILRKR